MSAQPSHEIDLDVAKLVLDVGGRKLRTLDTRIEDSVTDGTLARTIDGASTLTLTVHDPRRALLRSGAFDQAVDVRLDRLFFRLVQVSKSGDDLTLTFEDREVALLRSFTSARKAPRAKVTRAEFALSLVREVKPSIPFVCPDLTVRQPISKATQAIGDTTRAKSRDKGLPPGAYLTVKSVRADLGQRQIGQQMLDVASSLGAGATATLALIEACIVESLIRNLSGGDRDSRGVLQVRDGTARGMGIDNRDPAQCAHTFLTRGFYTDPVIGGGGAIAIANRHPEVSAGRVAQATQGSGKPNAYDTREAEAQAWLDAYSGGGSSGTFDTAAATKLQPYQFRRGDVDGTVENSWDCLQRLARDVRWRCFMSAGSLFFIDDDALMRSKPRLVVAESDPAVLGIDFDLDSGKPVSEATVTARASRWSAPPGSVVQLVNTGPADGRWLVSTISRGIFDATATITLHRAEKALPEPQADPALTSTTGGYGGATGDSLVGISGSIMDRVIAAARAIHNHRYPYVWGGGHVSAGTPDRGTGRDPGIGYDCSGSTGAVLAAAGLGFQLGSPIPVSGTFASSWGQEGVGDRLTVYANDVHVWMVIDGQHFGTGDWGKGWGGPGFNPNMHPTDGFIARHWPDQPTRDLPNAYGPSSPRSNRPG